jgi:hypothetical protein
VRVGSRAAQDRAGGVLVQVVTGVTVSRNSVRKPIEIGVTAPCSYGCVQGNALEDNLLSTW